MIELQEQAEILRRIVDRAIPSAERIAFFEETFPETAGRNLDSWLHIQSEIQALERMINEQTK